MTYIDSLQATAYAFWKAGGSAVETKLLRGTRYPLILRTGCLLALVDVITRMTTMGAWRSFTLGCLDSVAEAYPTRLPVTSARHCDKSEMLYLSLERQREM